MIHSALLFVSLILYNPVLAESELENKVKVRFILKKKKKGGEKERVFQKEIMIVKITGSSIVAHLCNMQNMFGSILHNR